LGKNNSYFTAAQKALDEGRWKNALSEAKQVIDTLLAERIKPIIQTAESKIAASKPLLSVNQDVPQDDQPTLP